MTSIEEHFKAVDWSIVKKKHEEMGKANTRIISSLSMLFSLLMVENFMIPVLLSVEAELASPSSLGFIVQIMPYMWYMPGIMFVYSIYTYLRGSAINVMRTSDVTQEES